jgi:hypothetical protein
MLKKSFTDLFVRKPVIALVVNIVIAVLGVVAYFQLNTRQYPRSDSAVVAGLQLEAAMLPIHTVAAGGGSMLHFDGERLQVGPASAGAQPGPACYGRGGPLTITDANLLLGRLQPAGFPAVFGASGDQPLDPEPVEVTEHVRVSSVTTEAIRTRRRMRRYVQVLGGTSVYFKALGDPRVVSRTTGAVFGE